MKTRNPKSSVQSTAFRLQDLKTEPLQANGTLNTWRRVVKYHFIVVPLALLLAAIPAFSQTKRATTAKSASPKSGPSSVQFEKLAKQANAAREANRLEEAISLYLQALKMKPKWNEGWWYVGSMFYDRDLYAEASEAFKNLASIDPKFGPGLSMLGLCEFQLKQYEAALKHLRQGNGLGFGDNQELRRVARYHEAILLNRFENYELAFDVLRRFINTDNESPDVISTIGLAMLRLPYFPGDVPADKREVVFKTGRAAFFSITNHPKEAQQEYAELVAAFPKSPGVHYAYGVYLLRENPDTALEEFKRELELSPQHVAARLQIAFEYIKRHEYAAGLPYAQEAVQLAPELFTAHNALGRILLNTGDIQGAVRELELSVKQAPDSPEMYFILARAYIKAGRSEDAAKARAEFARLDKIRRSGREGTASEAKPEEKP